MNTFPHIGDALAPAERDAISKLRFHLEAIEQIKGAHRSGKKVAKRT